MVKRTLLVSLMLLCAGVGYFLHYFFWAEHTIYERRDAKTGMKFMATCQYSEHSYRTYVTVASPSGRVISRNEIPYSADHLSDCTREPHYMVIGLTPDAVYGKLSVQFASKSRTPIEVPLMLEGIDLPNPPNQQSAQTAQ